MTDVAILPFIGVDCDGIRSIVGLKNQKVYGRAIGRAIAHELFHAITGTTLHSPVGIMRAELNQSDIVSDKPLRFSEKQYEQLIANKICIIK